MATFTEHLEAQHQAGLDRRYDDVMAIEWADAADREVMAQGCHFDYKAQVWVDGHDHAHISTGDQGLPLLFCGADDVTCTGSKLHDLMAAALLGVSA